MNDPVQKSTSVWTQVGWLVGIWTVSVLALFAAASVMRLFMSAAGLTS